MYTQRYACYSVSNLLATILRRGCDVLCNQLHLFSPNFILLQYFPEFRHCVTSTKYFISFNEFLNLLSIVKTRKPFKINPKRSCISTNTENLLRLSWNIINFVLWNLYENTSLTIVFLFYIFLFYHSLTDKRVKMHFPFR